MYKNRKKMEKFEQINIPRRKQLGTNNGLRVYCAMYRMKSGWKRWGVGRKNLPRFGRPTLPYKSAFFCA